MSGFKCPKCGNDSFAYTEGELCPNCLAEEEEEFLLTRGLKYKNEGEKKIFKKPILKD